jgi:hypothetical protein
MAWGYRCALPWSLWLKWREFGILRKGEVQGCILRLGSGTGGHHERCS